MNIKIATVLTVVGIMTLCLVITNPSSNHAFAQRAVQCSLTLKADPGSGSLATDESVEQKLSGKLSCGGTELLHSVITFSSSPWEGVKGSTFTDSSGNFQGPHFLVYPHDSFTVRAFYGGDSKRSLSGAEYSLPIIMHEVAPK